MSRLPIRSETDVVLVRQAVRQWASELSFSLVDQTKIVTAASELARNVLVHGGGGTVCPEFVEERSRRGLRLTFEDQGRGIPDIELALRDGYTTGGGLGSGVGWNETSRQRIRDRVPAGRGNPCYDHEVEVTRAAPTSSLDLTDMSQIGEARRAVTALARRLGFDDTGCGQAALVVSEAASNVLKHAGQGELLAREIEHDDAIGLELLILDKGPGMADPARCLRDGFSTKGTAGIGLGALARLSDFFDVHSIPAVGTAVLIRVWSRPAGAQGPVEDLKRRGHRSPGSRRGPSRQTRAKTSAATAGPSSKSPAEAGCS